MKKQHLLALVVLTAVLGYGGYDAYMLVGNKMIVGHATQGIRFDTDADKTAEITMLGDDLAVPGGVTAATVTAGSATVSGNLDVTGDTGMGGDLDVAGVVYADVFEGFGTGYTGIGTTEPAAMLEVAGGEVYVNYSTGGIILTSPDETCARCTIDNSDTFSCTSITCPTAP